MTTGTSGPSTCIRKRWNPASAPLSLEARLERCSAPLLVTAYWMTTYLLSCFTIKRRSVTLPLNSVHLPRNTSTTGDTAKTFLTCIVIHRDVHLTFDPSNAFKILAKLDHCPSSWDSRWWKVNRTLGGVHEQPRLQLASGEILLIDNFVKKILQ